MSRRAPLIALVLLLVAVAVGAVVLSNDNGDGGTGVQAGDAPSTTRTSAPASSTTTTVRDSVGFENGGFPSDVPRTGDEECSVPETDPSGPAIEEAGEPTDGITVDTVVVTDDAEGRVLFRANVTGRPVVSAESGSQWVVITMTGVRRVDPSALELQTAHAKQLEANVCDDSAFAWAFAFDAEVASLDLVEHSEEIVEIAVEFE